MKYSKNKKVEAYNNIKHFKHCNIVINVTSMSKIGIPIRIKIYASKANTLTDITNYIAVLTDYAVSKNGLFIDEDSGTLSILFDLNFVLAEIETSKTPGELLRSGKLGKYFYTNYFLNTNKIGKQKVERLDQTSITPA